MGVVHLELSGFRFSILSTEYRTEYLRELLKLHQNGLHYIVSPIN
jgi:hypothetical protein